MLEIALWATWISTCMDHKVSQLHVTLRPCPSDSSTISLTEHEKYGLRDAWQNDNASIHEKYEEKSDSMEAHVLVISTLILYPETKFSYTFFNLQLRFPF